MTTPVDLPGPQSFEEVKMACASYHRYELRRDVIYRVTRHTIDEYWGNPGEVSDAVAKAFHVLAPEFFPLWDDEMARSYGCKWHRTPEAAEKYLHLIALTKGIVDRLVASVAQHRQLRPQGALWFMCQSCPNGARWNSFLKMLDDYNYVRYTKSWFQVS